MVVTDVAPGGQRSWVTPKNAEFLRLFGAICAVPSVARVGTLPEASALALWVKLGANDEDHERQIYAALRHYRSAAADVPVDLHVVFADEDEPAFPSAADVVFQRP